MNSSSFLYQIPFPQQSYFNFYPFASQAPLIMFNPCYNFPQGQVPLTESYGMNLPNSAKYPQNSDLQDTKIQLDQSSKTSSCKQKKIKKSKTSKKYKIQRLRDDKGRYSGVCKHLTTHKYKQNPKRNVLTNIGNQLLAFASSKSKSLPVLTKVCSPLSQQEIDQFYNFVLELRDRTDYYLNITKMSEIWYPSSADVSEAREKSRKLFRQVSYEYLNNIIRLFVLCSNKIKSPSKIFHIKAINTLLQELTRRDKN